MISIVVLLVIGIENFTIELPFLERFSLTTMSILLPTNNWLGLPYFLK